MLKPKAQLKLGLKWPSFTHLDQTVNGNYCRFFSSNPGTYQAIRSRYVGYSNFPQVSLPRSIATLIKVQAVCA